MSHKFREPYDEKRNTAERERARLCCPEESLTQKQFAEDADLNVIVRRFGVTDHEMPIAPPDPTAYGDVSEMPDLRTVLENARAAQEAFMRLPAQIRARFHNDPAVLHEFVTRPENREEAEQLGLLERKVEPKRRADDPKPRRRKDDFEAERRELEEYRSGRRKPPGSPPAA